MAYEPTGNPRGRPKLTEEQIAQKAKDQAAFEERFDTVLVRPYKTPKELQRKMEKYFDRCEGAGMQDWRDVIQDFVDLSKAMENYPNRTSHKGNFDKLIDKIKHSDLFPDEAGMRVFLGMNHEVYRSYKTDPEYTTVFDWAQDMRESWAARHLAADPKAAQAFLNILKQEGNGGWVDRKMDSGEQTLTVKAAGVGGMEAFK